MHVHEDIGAKRTAAILICAGWVLDRRHVGKNLSVHIRRPAASSCYWKSNWSDTCIFELNEPGFSIHSFWVGVTPACKLGTETKNWTCDKSPSEQGLPPHTKAVCRENISSVAFSNGDLVKTVPANFKMIPCRKSEKRIRKALQKWANIEARNVMTKMQWQKCRSMKISGQNGQQQYLLALVECLIDVRLGKTFSVHIRRPAASSYWKSNWSDTCIFWIKWARLFNPLILSRSDPAETQSLIWRMSGWRYSTVRLSTYYSNWMSSDFLSPLILRRADPADTQSRIWCTSGTDSRSEKGNTSADRKPQVHRWSKNLGYRVTPHLKAVLSQTIIVTCCFI